MTTHTRNRSADQVVLKTARTERAAETFAWLRLLNGDRDPMALAVGVVLIDHFNPMEGGQARPGCALMAAKLGVAESTVIRAIRRMHKRGRLKVAWGCPGRGHPNRYWMVVKPAPAQVSEAGKPARKKPAPEENKTCASAGEPLKRTIVGDGEAKASPISVERETAPSARDSIAVGGSALRAAPDLFEDEDHPSTAEPAAKPKRSTRGEQTNSAEPEILTPNSRQQEPSAAPRDVVDIGEERAWRELREIWDRGWAGDDSPRSIAVARVAFAKACAVADGGGAAIVEAAKVWRANCDAPRFLQRLSDWLAAEGWTKPPPAKAKRGRAGDRAERSRYDRPSIASRLLAIAEREA